MKVLFIDNFDSFSWNLVHYLQIAGLDVLVKRNDEVEIQDLDGIKGMVISPGPGRPEDSGATLSMLAASSDRNVPILGICLGQQAIGQFCGLSLVHAPYPMHGKVSELARKDHYLFEGVSERFSVMRYHSLVLLNDDKSDLETIAWTSDGLCMAIAHRIKPWVGVQFHPESILSPEGMRIIYNWAAELKKNFSVQ